MKVELERLRELRRELDEINQARLEDIEFFERGRLITVPDSSYEYWRLVGLNNVDFALTEVGTPRGECAVTPAR